MLVPCRRFGEVLMEETRPLKSLRVFGHESRVPVEDCNSTSEETCFIKGVARKVT